MVAPRSDSEYALLIHAPMARPYGGFIQHILGAHACSKPSSAGVKYLLTFAFSGSAHTSSVKSNSLCNPSKKDRGVPQSYLPLLSSAPFIRLLVGGEGRNRTCGLHVFNMPLYQLSYLPKWSGRRDSNPHYPPWHGGALPLNYSRLCTGSLRDFHPTTLVSSASCFTYPPLARQTGTGLRALARPYTPRAYYITPAHPPSPAR